MNDEQRRAEQKQEEHRTACHQRAVSSEARGGFVNHSERADLVVAVVEAEAEASDDAEAARKARSALATHDAAAETHVVIDYERGITQGEYLDD